MQNLALLSGALSFGLAILVGFAMGVRLLLVAKRSRQFPEAAIGFASLCMGLGGLFDVGALIPGAASFRYLFSSLETSLYSAAAASMCLAAWKLFRPGSAAARMAAFAGIAILVAAVAAMMLGGGHLAAEGGLRPGFTRTAYFTNLTARCLAYAWLGTEALVYWGEQRRAVRLGLADSFLTHRFLLWGISSVCLCLMLVASIGARMLYGHTISSDTVGLYSLSLLGMIANVSIWCAFFPPAVYRRWLDRFSKAEG